MNEIIVEYTDKDGKDRQLEIDDETITALDLSRHKIVTIKLETLAGLDDLQDLNLGSNSISKIDLSHLAEI